MKVSVIGTGYVGLISGVGFASKGHNVLCVDNNQEKVNQINSKKAPIYEKGLKELLEETVPENLQATTDLKKAVLETEVSFICVGTPSQEDGKCDLSALKAVSTQIGQALKEKDSFHVIVVKSTVVPGTTLNEVAPILEKESGKTEGKEFAVVMNPEFLREGIALKDFLEPDRVVIGTNSKKARELLSSIYVNFSGEIMETNPTTAEMIKYASNSFLATKISFINEIGNICKKLGIDTKEVARGMALDHRISPFFLAAGIGFGGSCFPKDVQALMQKAKESGVSTPLLDSVMQVNEEQPIKLMQMAKNRTSLKGKRVAVLGLAFKPDTDDVRESRSIVLIKKLLEEGAVVSAHDPKAEENMKEFFPEISYSDSAQKLVDKSEVVFILTAWKDYTGLDYRDKLVLDGRNLFGENRPLNYEGICW